jgi:hypothetical protein
MLGYIKKKHFLFIQYYTGFLYSTLLLESFYTYTNISKYTVHENLYIAANKDLKLYKSEQNFYLACIYRHEEIGLPIPKEWRKKVGL